MVSDSPNSFSGVSSVKDCKYDRRRWFFIDKREMPSFVFKDSEEASFC